jgi:hypothetical protein
VHFFQIASADFFFFLKLASADSRSCFVQNWFSSLWDKKLAEEYSIAMLLQGHSRTGSCLLLDHHLTCICRCAGCSAKGTRGKGVPRIQGSPLGVLRTSTPSQLSCFRRPRLSSWVTVSMNSCNAVNEIRSECF